MYKLEKQCLHKAHAPDKLFFQLRTPPQLRRNTPTRTPRHKSPNVDYYLPPTPVP